MTPKRNKKNVQKQAENKRKTLRKRSEVSSSTPDALTDKGGSQDDREDQDSEEELKNHPGRAALLNAPPKRFSVFAAQNNLDQFRGVAAPVQSTTVLAAQNNLDQARGEHGGLRLVW